MSHIQDFWVKKLISNISLIKVSSLNVKFIAKSLICIRIESFVRNARFLNTCSNPNTCSNAPIGGSITPDSYMRTINYQFSFICGYLLSIIDKLQFRQMLSDNILFDKYQVVLIHYKNCTLHILEKGPVRKPISLKINHYTNHCTKQLDLI